MTKGFTAFLKEYGVIGLAIAVVIGGKLNALVGSLVDNLVMPFVGMLLPSGNWRELSLTLAGAKFGVGPFLGSLLDFLIVALLVYAFSKRVLKEETVTKK